MVVEWHWLAERGLKNIYDHYFDVAGRLTAMKTVSQIWDSVRSLGAMPFMAPIEPLLEGEAEVFRSLVVLRRYKAVYIVEDETVIVTDVWDCRQDPEMFGERIAEMAEMTEI